MKKLVLVLVLLAATVAAASAQKALDKSTVANVDTASPTFDFVYTGAEGDGAVRIEVHDRQHQFTSFSFFRLNDRAKGGDATNYRVKLINMPEIGPLAFRQVESLEEAKLPVDGIKVLEAWYLDLLDAARIKYN